MGALRTRARQTLRTAGFAGVTGAMLPAFLARMAATPEAQRDAVRDAWVRAWARALLRLFGVRVEVVGEIPPRDGARVVVANHRSAADIGVILSTFGGTMLSRADLASWPVVGAAARSVGTIFVDRSSARSGAVAIRTAVALLEAGGQLDLFPEGTTFAEDEVRPFHPGAFTAAARARAEILPVGLAYPEGSGAAYVDETFLSHLGRMARAEPSRVVVCVGAPFTPAPGERSAEIATRARDAVQALVTRARARSRA